MRRRPDPIREPFLDTRYDRRAYANPEHEPLVRNGKPQNQHDEWMYWLALIGIAVFYIVSWLIIHSATEHRDKLPPGSFTNTGTRIVYQEKHQKRARDFKRRAGIKDIDISDEKAERDLLSSKRIPQNIQYDDPWADLFKPKSKEGGFNNWFGDDYFKHDDDTKDWMKELFPHLYNEPVKTKEETKKEEAPKVDEQQQTGNTQEVNQQQTRNQAIPNQNQVNQNQGLGGNTAFQQNPGTYQYNQPMYNQQRQPMYTQPMYNNQYAQQPQGYQNPGNFQQQRPQMNAGYTGAATQQLNANNQAGAMNQQEGYPSAATQQPNGNNQAGAMNQQKGYPSAATQQSNGSNQAGAMNQQNV